MGVGCDWILFRTLGPSREQSWDSYLANYLDNLPNRAGRFERLPSFWSRIVSVFHRSHDPLTSSFDEESLPSTLGRIPKDPKKRMPRKTAPTVRFDLASGSSDSGSEIEIVSSTRNKETNKGALFLDPSDSASDLTLMGSGRVSPRIKNEQWTLEKYEELDADITSNNLLPDERLRNWKPTFLSKAREYDDIKDDY